MKRIDLLISTSLIFILLLQGCVSTVGPEPEEKETYTWQGTLYKGLGEAPWPDANLTLIGAESVGAGKKYHTLATGKTDENGHFMLQYEWERDWHQAGEGQVDLEVNGGYPIMWAPWNVNVDRDMCQNNHSTIYLRVRVNPALNEADSLFCNLVPIENSYTNIKILNHKTIAILGPLEKDTFFHYKIGVTGQYDNAPHAINLWWGVSNLNHQGYQQVRGFPYTDTITITTSTTR